MNELPKDMKYLKILTKTASVNSIPKLYYTVYRKIMWGEEVYYRQFLLVFSRGYVGRSRFTNMFLRLHFSGLFYVYFVCLA